MVDGVVSPQAFSLLLVCHTSLLHLCILQLLRKVHKYPQDAKVVLPTAKYLFPAMVLDWSP